MKEIFLTVNRTPRGAINCEKPSDYLSLRDTDKKLKFLQFLNEAEKCSDSAFDYSNNFHKHPFNLSEIFRSKFSSRCLQGEEASQFIGKQLIHCPVNTTSASVLPDSTTYFNYPELYIAIGHGIGNGVINALNQQLFAYLNSKSYRSSRIKAILLSLSAAITHSVYAASLPIFFTHLQNSSKEDGEQTNKMLETLVQQVIPIFSTNMIFSVGFQLVNYFQENYLESSALKNLVRNIPVVSTAWAAISNPIATATNTVTSTVSSFATLTLFNYFFSKPTTSPQEKIELNTLAHADAKEQVKLEKFLPQQPKTYRYITLDELTKIQKEVSEIINKLEMLQKSLETSIEAVRKQCQEANIPALLESSQKIIANQFNILKIVKNGLIASKPLEERLNDDMHQEACKEHTDRHQYITAMEKLGNVFKLTQTNYQEMINKLNEAIGIVEGLHSYFDQNIQGKLKEIITNIQFTLSKVGAYITIYSTANAAEKAKKEGLKEGANGTLQTILTTPNFFKPPHRPYSEVASYTSHSSGSDGSDESLSYFINNKHDSINFLQPLLKNF